VPACGLVGGVGVGQSGRAVAVAYGGAGVGGPRTDAVDGADNALYCVAVIGGTVVVAASVPAMSASAGLVGGVGVGQSGRAVVVAYVGEWTKNRRS
jgi:hypothetical protein